MNGKITISSPRSNKKGHYIQISIVDDDSNTQFVEIEMKLEDFAAAITGLARCPIEFKINQINNVEKKKKFKTIFVKKNDNIDDLKEYLSEYETNAWKFETISNYGNSHYEAKKMGVDGYTMTLVRYI